MLRFLLAVAVVSALSGVAKADDFKMVVIDPTSFTVNVITDPTFAFSFSPCVLGQVPPGAGTFDGCFTGLNETGFTLTSLFIDIPAVVDGQTVGCALDGGGFDLFTNVSCQTNANGYILDFSGAPGVGEGVQFTIAEQGAPPQDFPDTINAVANAPEPNSFWLMSTGVLSVGLFGAYRRRQVLIEPRR
jgi:hypothetical protein